MPSRSEEDERIIILHADQFLDPNADLDLDGMTIWILAYISESLDPN